MPYARSYALPSFGKRFRRLRVAKGVKQEAVASEFAVSQTTVSRWENRTQTPSLQTQHQVLDYLNSAHADDAALRRLVESSSQCVHLVDEASHKCLSYSKPRARDWNATDRGLLGVSLWQFATEEIRYAEMALEDEGWWDDLTPSPRTVVTSFAAFPQLKISAGAMLWERVYLADGTPARLVTGIS